MADVLSQNEIDSLLAALSTGELDTDQIQEKEEKILLLEKGKRGILNIVFGRTTVVMLLLVFQLLVLFGFFAFLGEYIVVAFGSSVVFSVVMIIILINRSMNPAMKLTWAILILLLPIFGASLYFFVETELGHRLLHKRLEYLIQESRPYIPQKGLSETLKEDKRDLYNLEQYTLKHGGFPAYENTEVKYFASGEAKFEALIAELEKAEKFIFLEYFTINEGYMWGRILNILERKAREGVEVRVMYDGTCSIFLLPNSYPKKLKALGIKCKTFAPLRPLVSTYYNNRDHRKIAIIDGHTAFTGGVNLSDEYINKKTLHGHWKDAAIMLRGEAVKSFTLMFLQMWDVDNRVRDYNTYVNVAHKCRGKAEGYVLPYGDSPLDSERVGEMVYLDIINNAKRYVHIMTPYLILDYEMLQALTFAAKRGVEVCIILPHIPDKKYAFALAKTHYKDLIAAGVKVYEYLPGFIHSKVFVSDDKRAVVGTINLDFRSLYLHFECAAYLHEVPVIDDIEKDMQETMQISKLITMNDVKKEKLSMRLAGILLKFIAPLM